MLGKIAIFGAGVGGLTAAHYLADFAESIDIYEKNPTAGGLARTEVSGSGSTSGSGECDTKEISWRVYFHFYNSLFEIMKNIPSYDRRPVTDHLVAYKNVFTPPIDPFSFMTINQILKIIRTIASSKSRIDSYDNIPWRDFIGSDDAEIPQWLGMDRFKGSTTSVQRIGIEQHLRKTKGIEDYVLDGPTNYVWFDPWVLELKKRGVRFHFNSEVKEIYVDDKKITGAKVIPEGQVNADIYIIGLPVEALAKLLGGLAPTSLKLSGISRQIQIAFQLHLSVPKGISFGKDHDGSEYQSFLVRKSPWAIIVESKTISWSKNTDLSRCKSTQWSITACQTNVPGILNGKTLMESTEKEAQDEIIAEILDSKAAIKRLKDNNVDLNIEKILKEGRWATPFSSFKFADGNTLLSTTEPKFSNNIGTKALRPSIILGPNAFLSTAYTKETIDVFSMEAAAISGKAVADFLIGGRGKMRVVLPPRPYGDGTIEGFRNIDEVLFCFGLPDILMSMFIVGVILILYWGLKRFKR